MARRSNEQILQEIMAARRGDSDQARVSVPLSLLRWASRTINRKERQLRRLEKELARVGIAGGWEEREVAEK